VNDTVVVGRREHVEQSLRLEHNLSRVETFALSSLPTGVQRLSLEQLEDEIRTPELILVVIHYAYGARMSNAVRGVSFARESCAHGCIFRELGVQKLDCDAIAVAMGRGVYGCHAADAEQRVETVLIANRGAHTGAASVGQGHRNGTPPVIVPP
jgi:hypothetical protein